jgi:DNA-directed RNA polymerase specialized sigma subunit
MGDMIAQAGEPMDVIEGLRARYLDAVDAVQQAGDRTIEALVAARDAREIARRHASARRPMIELEAVIDPQALRISLGGALAELERTRHDAQRLLFQLLQAEGVTLADIGRAYGISRQLVSRLVNEADPPPAG